MSLLIFFSIIQTFPACREQRTWELVPCWVSISASCVWLALLAPR